MGWWWQENFNETKLCWYGPNNVDLCHTFASLDFNAFQYTKVNFVEYRNPLAKVATLKGMGLVDNSSLIFEKHFFYITGHFSLPNLLLQVVSLVGLLTLTATIIDTFALYLIPNKDIYRQYVFDSSPELQKRMQDLRQEEKEKDEWYSSCKSIQLCEKKVWTTLQIIGLMSKYYVQSE